MKNNSIEETNIETEIYDIPLEVTSGFRPLYHILFIFTIIGLGAMTALMFYMNVTQSSLTNGFFGVFFFLLDAFLICFYIIIGFLKIIWLRLDWNKITMKSFRKTKEVKWADIVSIDIIENQHAESIGLVTEETSKRSLAQKLWIGKYKMTISMAIFSHLNTKKLFATLSYMADHSHKAMDLPE